MQTYLRIFVRFIPNSHKLEPTQASCGEFSFCSPLLLPVIHFIGHVAGGDFPPVPAAPGWGSWSDSPLITELLFAVKRRTTRKASPCIPDSSLSGAHGGTPGVERPSKTRPSLHCAGGRLVGLRFRAKSIDSSSKQLPETPAVHTSPGCCLRRMAERSNPPPPSPPDGKVTDYKAGRTFSIHVTQPLPPTHTQKKTKHKNKISCALGIPILVP